MELAILVAFMVFTIGLMIGMSWVFKGWLKHRSDLIDKDQND